MWYWYIIEKINQYGAQVMFDGSKEMIRIALKETEKNKISINSNLVNLILNQ